MAKWLTWNNVARAVIGAAAVVTAVSGAGIVALPAAIVKAALVASVVAAKFLPGHGGNAPAARSDDPRPVRPPGAILALLAGVLAGAGCGAGDEYPLELERRTGALTTTIHPWIAGAQVTEPVQLVSAEMDLRPKDSDTTAFFNNGVFFNTVALNAIVPGSQEWMGSGFRTVKSASTYTHTHFVRYAGTSGFAQAFTGCGADPTHTYNLKVTPIWFGLAVAGTHVAVFDKTTSTTCTADIARPGGPAILASLDTAICYVEIEGGQPFGKFATHNMSNCTGREANGVGHLPGGSDTILYNMVDGGVLKATAAIPTGGTVRVTWVSQ